MRITADLLKFQVEQRINPLGDRELVLRGRGIAVLEHMAVTLDQYDAWDLTDNRLTSLDNLPKLARLRTILCDNNVIERIDIANLQRNCSQLHTLSLGYNRISALSEIGQLGKACPHLRYLTLIGNPVTRKFHYKTMYYYCYQTELIFPSSLPVFLFFPSLLFDVSLISYSLSIFVLFTIRSTSLSLVHNSPHFILASVGLCQSACHGTHRSGSLGPFPCRCLGI
jgi:hypothetical protein